MGRQKTGDEFRTSRRQVLRVGAAGLGALIAPAVIGVRRASAAAPQETTIDRIKRILESLEREQREPSGADDDLIADLERMVERLAPTAAPEMTVMTGM